MSNKDPRLFLDDEFEETNLNPEPVVCLGMEFPCEEARRDYFREELRKKLPELKKIEGFPIGEDDDIVNLSDPPYYTACPNPWLNGFIGEWEKEKEELEAAGKRKARFEVNEPYAADVSEGKNNPIYMAHAYHTKVPHPAIMRYILHYTQPGDIVFDGFAGTGMTGVAAQLCGSKEDVEALGVKNAKVGVRKAICSDLSPIASLIAASYNLKFDVQSFAKKANAILNQVEDELGWMYETEVDGKKAKINYTIWSDVFVCPSCGQEITLWNEAVNLQEQKIKDSFPCPHCGATCSKKSMDKAWETSYDSLLNKTVTMNKKVPVRVNYTCNGRRGERDVVQSDLKLFKKIDGIDISDLSSIRMPEGDESRRNDRIGITHAHQFYSKRNFIYLSRVLELAKGDIFLQTWLTSVLQRTTYMSKFMFAGTGIVSGTLYIPSLNRVYSPHPFLTSKSNAFTRAFYHTRGKTAISINSATQLCNLPDASIDYIFTDPPFGSNIMYSELNFIWEAWIKVATNTKEEAIINKVQQKSLFEYQTLMNRSFLEYYRVLKPGKWITIEFSNTSASVWNSIQNALQGVGFIVVNVAALDKKQGSFKAVTTTTAVKQDLVITCYKPSDELTFKFEDALDKASNAMDFIEELLVHLPVHQEKDHSTTAVVERSPKILYDRLISYYVRHGYAIPMDAQEFQKNLRDRFIERDEMFFTASQALEYEDKKSKTTGIVPMALFIGSEAEGIEWLKRELETHQTYSELQPEWMKNMTPTKKGDILPELSEILEDNFIKDADGKWRKPDAEKAADMEIMRGRKMMKEYNMYLEQAQKPKARRMRDTRLEVLRYGFKECYKQKDYQAIITVGDHIQESLLQEDEILLQYYDIAVSRV
ncbi:hypothetical protein KCV26_15920 [Petrimonas sulfuriphila]|uniref:DNA methyltransferase n=1 Tax=Petrimonas sulfuriphila TaxID=285070 RepID=UPI003252F93F